MNRRRISWSGLGAVALVAAGGGAWILSLPPAPTRYSRAADREGGSRRHARGVEAAETPAAADCDHRHQRRHRGHRLSHALRHPSARRRRRRGAAGDGAGAGEALSGAHGRAAGDRRGVRCAASGRRRLCHRPGHEPRRRPGGARNGSRARRPRARSIIGVCAGAKVVGEAGLLDGKRATTHWYYVEELREKHPAIHYVADRRLVVDQGVATTTGVTASMPMSLTLIEAIAGREKAEAVGRDIGLTHWDARHDSECVPVHAPVCVDRDRQHGRVLEPGATRHRADARC